MGFNPRGFLPYRNLAGKVDHSTRRYRTRALNVTPLFVNDLVVLVSGATGSGVTSFRPAIDGTAAAAAPLGVVQGLYDSNKKPLVFSQPNKGPYLNAATDGYVDVIVDPHTTYLVNVNGTASAAMFGRFGVVDVTAMGTATGISNMGLSITTSNTNVVALTSANNSTPVDGTYPVLILGVAEFGNDVDNNTLDASFKSAFGNVEVKLAAPVFGNGPKNGTSRAVH